MLVAILSSVGSPQQHRSLTHGIMTTAKANFNLRFQVAVTFIDRFVRWDRNFQKLGNEKLKALGKSVVICGTCIMNYFKFFQVWLVVTRSCFCSMRYLWLSLLEGRRKHPIERKPSSENRKEGIKGRIRTDKNTKTYYSHNRVEWIRVFRARRSPFTLCKAKMRKGFVDPVVKHSRFACFRRNFGIQ